MLREGSNSMPTPTRNTRVWNFGNICKDVPRVASVTGSMYTDPLPSVSSNCLIHVWTHCVLSGFLQGGMSNSRMGKRRDKFLLSCSSLTFYCHSKNKLVSLHPVLLDSPRDRLRSVECNLSTHYSRQNSDIKFILSYRTQPASSFADVPISQKKTRSPRRIVMTRPLTGVKE